MRKSYFFAALLAMGALSSCSNDSENVAPVSQNNDGRQPILLGLGNPNDVNVTRAIGTGTVGDIEGDVNNVWNGEPINLLMVQNVVNKEAVTTLRYAEESEDGVTWTPIFADEPMTAPVGVAQGYLQLRAGEPTRYYPVSGSYEFFAYHEGGARTGDIDQTDDTKWYLPFTIDGSQDLMVAKAEVTTDQEDIMTAEGLVATDLYSAKSARHGIVPSMDFQHLLTRLKFYLIPGDDKAKGEGVEENAVRVTSIEIESKTTGNLLVAYKGDVLESEKIVWTDPTMVRLALMQRDEAATELSALVPLEEVSLFGADETTGVGAGEALLVSPEDSYTMYVTLAQLPAGTTIEKNQTFKVPVGDGSVAFKAGHSYNVNITLYGMQRIDVNAVLTGWVNGGPVPVFPEDDGLIE